jgi:hypothetical protein
MADVDVGTLAAVLQLKDEMSPVLATISAQVLSLSADVAALKGKAGEAGAGMKQGFAMGLGVEAFNKAKEAMVGLIEVLPKLGEKFVEFSDEMTLMSIKTGMSTDAIQLLGAQGRVAGLTSADMVLSMKFLNKAFEESPEKIRGLGLSLEAIAAMNPEERLNAVGTAVAGIKDPAERSVAAMDLFGRQGLNTLPAFSEKARAARAEMEKFGFVIDKDLINKGHEIDERMGLAKAGFQAFTLELGGAIATSPAFAEAITVATEVLSKMVGWVRQNSAAITSWVTTGIMMALDGIQLLIGAIQLLGNVWDGLHYDELVIQKDILDIGKKFADFGVMLAQMAVNSPNMARMLGIDPDMAKKELAGMQSVQDFFDGYSQHTQEDIDAVKKTNDDWNISIGNASNKIEELRTRLTNASFVTEKAEEKTGKYAKVNKEAATAVAELKAKLEEIRTASDSSLTDLEKGLKKVDQELEKNKATLAAKGMKPGEEKEQLDLYVKIAAAQKVALNADHAKAWREELAAANLELEKADVEASGLRGIDKELVLIDIDLRKEIADIQKRTDLNSIEKKQLEDIAKARSADAAAERERAAAAAATREASQALSSVLSSMNGLLGSLGMSSTSWTGTLISGLSSAVSTAGDFNATLQEAGGSWSDLTNAQKGQALSSGIGALGGIIKGTSGTGVMGGFSGAAQGAAMGSAFGAPGAIIGGGIGAIAGLASGIFGGNKELMQVNDLRDAWQKNIGTFDDLAKKAGDAHVSLSAYLKADTVEKYTAAVKDLEKAFAASDARSEYIKAAGGAHELEEAAKKAGVPLKQLFDAKSKEDVDAFTKSFGELVDAQQQLKDIASAAIDQFGASMAKAVDTSALQKETLKKSYDAGKITAEQYEAGLKEVKITGIQILTPADAEAQASITMLSFAKMAKEKGLIAAGDAFRPVADAMAANLAAIGGDEKASAILAPFFKQIQLSSNEAFRGATEGAQGFADVLRGFRASELPLTIDQVSAFGQQAASAFAQAKSGGADDATALAAIAPLLGQIQGAAAQYGL